MNNTVTPVYARIALDLAARIASGSLNENVKISGRSVLSSEYGVSPETIRRAVNLLHDVGVVEIKSNSGITIQSKELAKEYVAKFSSQNDLRALRRELRKTIKEQDSTSAKIAELAGVIADLSEKYTSTNPFQNYETEINNESHIIGRTISETQFWQSTGATIIALRREGQIILSPGPYTAFLAGDILVYVGELSCIEAVTRFVNER